MKDFVIKNNLYLMTALGVAVALYTMLMWSTMPVLQRMDGLFFGALILHLWEEGRFPGGFTEMFTEKLNFTQKNPHFGEIIASTYVLYLAFIPFLFPNIVFLAMAPMLLGIVEAIAHVAAIKMFDLKRPYSPGLVTALFLLLPVSIYTIVYAVQHNLTQPTTWLFSLLYMGTGLLLAQQIVVRMSGMKYTDFLKNVRATIFSSQE